MNCFEEKPDDFISMAEVARGAVNDADYIINHAIVNVADIKPEDRNHLRQLVCSGVALGLLKDYSFTPAEVEPFFREVRRLINSKEPNDA